MFNQRGTGISDRVAGVPTLEMRMDDIRAVMDAAGSQPAVVFGSVAQAHCPCYSLPRIGSGLRRSC